MLSKITNKQWLIVAVTLLITVLGLTVALTVKVAEINDFKAYELKATENLIIEYRYENGVESAFDQDFHFYEIKSFRGGYLFMIYNSNEDLVFIEQIKSYKIRKRG